MPLGLAFLLAVVAGTSCQKPAQSLSVMTVNGPLKVEEMGITLTHEHVLVDFIGADQAVPGRYDPDEVFAKALPFLRELRARDCRTFIECTPPFMARDPVLLKKLSQETGLNILVSTGYYAAQKHKYLPASILEENPDELADRVVGEWENGIAGSGIKPGFIKIAVDRDGLSDIQRKVVRAAARAHLRTGLAIVSHTGPAAEAFEQVEILKEEGVDPSAFIWIHAQVEKDIESHVKAGKLGAWVSLDGLRNDDIERYVEILSRMKSADLLGRALVSHDSGYYVVGETNGGNFVGYARLFEEFLPALRKAGFSEGDIKLLLVDNPAEAFAYRVRTLKEKG
jgi:phosphotriesterase-related protein